MNNVTITGRRGFFELLYLGHQVGKESVELTILGFYVRWPLLWLWVNVVFVSFIGFSGACALVPVLELRLPFRRALYYQRCVGAIPDSINLFSPSRVNQV